MTDLRYPIGRIDFSGHATKEQRNVAIADIEHTPEWLRDAVHNLSDAQLDTPYRPEGWTVRQVVHHVADSHLNSLTRFKLTLTEDKPTIRTYDEARWAELPDAAGPPKMSLRLLDALHERWVYLLRNISDADWKRELIHPDLGNMRLDELLVFYGWHGRHHVAHITNLRKREGW
ncbi:MAG: bacillithiol transferase BstA [Gemmatimonadetes bacterium]|nr:bacillithiol transferase BstA [Gemmatimonadota bacterium]